MVLASLVTFLVSDPQITLDLPASRLSQVLLRVEEACGEKVKATGPDQDQFVFVKVDKMPLSRLRESLAFVTRGSWVKSDDTWVLKTVPWWHAREEVHQASIRRWLQLVKALPKGVRADDQKVVQEILDRSKQDDPAGYSWEEEEKFFQRTPTFRLLARTVQSLPINELLTLGATERKVFSSHPTFLQGRLPPISPGLLQDYAWERRLRQAEDLGETHRPASNGHERVREVSETARIHLVLNRDEVGVTLALNFFAGDGSRIDTIESIIPLQ